MQTWHVSVDSVSCRIIYHFEKISNTPIAISGDIKASTRLHPIPNKSENKGNFILEI